MKLRSKIKLGVWLKKRISFRFHMSLIIFSTVIMGMIANFFALDCGLTNPGYRYPLTVFISYITFLLFIRFYLRGIIERSDSGLLDVLDLTPDRSVISASETTPNWIGGGGQFSGGGASGPFSEGISGTAKIPAKSESGIGLDAIDLDEGAILFVVIGMLVAAVIFGSGVYFIWHAPEILSECLLQILLVTGMKRQMKKIPEKEWLTHILKSTWVAFLLVTIISGIFGLYLRQTCPVANTIKDYKQFCWR